MHSPGSKIFFKTNYDSYASGLKRFLKKNAEGETLAVMDSKLGSIIKEKLGISCTYRCILQSRAAKPLVSHCEAGLLSLLYI